MRRARRYLAFAAACAALIGCARFERVPAAATPEFPRAAPAEVGLDGRVLDAWVAALPRGHRIHAMLVVRRGKLAYERYFAGYDADTLHDLRSVTKSVTALLVGISIERGELDGVEAPMMATLRAAYPGTDAAKDAIRVEDLLTMRSGLDCDDRDRGSRGQEDRMYRTREWVEHFLDLPVRRPPGAAAHYCTGGVVALGRMVELAAGAPFAEVARARLFEPLGVEHFRYATYDDGRRTDTGGHLRLRPRDLAKIGQLVLDEGRWQGRQVVPASWVAAATAEHTRVDGVPYGYLWWRDRARTERFDGDVVFASGNGGQHVFVVRELELVVVFTGGAYNSPQQALPFQLFARGVLGAVTDR